MPRGKRAHTVNQWQFYHAVGERVAYFRGAVTGITQDDLAKEIGLSRTAVTNIEKGNQALSLHHAVLMARVFGCSMDDLLDIEFRLKPSIVFRQES